MAAWPDDIPTQIPLESVLYAAGSNALLQAQFIQHDYYTRTDHFLPLLRMNLNDTRPLSATTRPISLPSEPRPQPTAPAPRQSTAVIEEKP
ncbi:hypothetical protein [Pseudomonas putida]|uniref:hypothetical protein n=1 Tax=Pseudomonas putida TaxID=303 RepID=UPI00125F8876|nr:hypothetical protein [Pseudomonas putida]